MGSDDILLELWNWLALNSPMGLVFNGIFVASLGGNLYLLKKLNEGNKIEKSYIELLKKVEPLLAKIIDGKKFSNSEVRDAGTIRDIIKFNLEKYAK